MHLIKKTIKKCVLFLKFIFNWTNLQLSQKTGALQQKLEHIITATYSQIFPHEVRNQHDSMVSGQIVEKILGK